MTTSEKLRTYIEAELKDSMLYAQLAQMAEYQDDRRLLLEFSKDEETHAKVFQQIYRSLTGRTYDPVVRPPEFTGSFYKMIRDRILDESGDFRKYGEQYLITENNPKLKDAYYRARTDENLHALRLIYILSRPAG